MKTTITLSLSCAILLGAILSSCAKEREYATFRSEEFGFSIDYPKDWFVENELLSGPLLAFAKKQPIEDSFTIQPLRIPNIRTLQEFIDFSASDFGDYFSCGKLQPTAIGIYSVMHMICHGLPNSSVASQTRSVYYLENGSTFIQIQHRVDTSLLPTFDLMRKSIRIFSPIVPSITTIQ
ncbi:MAG: hypothetical protein WCG83_07245 [Candidatus Peregrinibacteria bacterium]